MAFWIPLIAAAASMAGNAAAADASASASEEGAKRYRDTQRSNIALQKEIQGDQLALQRPFYNKGMNALAGLAQLNGYSVTPRIRPDSNTFGSVVSKLPWGQIGNGAHGFAKIARDIRQAHSPAATAPNDKYGEFQSNLALSALLPRMHQQGVSPAVLSRMLEDINARNEGDYRARLYDMVKVGQGASQSAGNSYQSYGNALANAYSGIGNALAQGQAGAAQVWQNFGANAANTAGSIPSYLMTQSRPKAYTDSQGGEYTTYGNGARVKSIY